MGLRYKMETELDLKFRKRGHPGEPSYHSQILEYPPQGPTPDQFYLTPDFKL